MRVLASSSKYQLPMCIRPESGKVAVEADVFYVQAEDLNLEVPWAALRLK